MRYQQFVALFAIIWVAHGVEGAPDGMAFTCAQDETDEGKCDRPMKEMPQVRSTREQPRGCTAVG